MILSFLCTIFLIIFSYEDFSKFKISNKKIKVGLFTWIIFFFIRVNIFKVFQVYSFRSFLLRLFVLSFAFLMYLKKHLGAGDVKVIFLLILYTVELRYDPNLKPSSGIVPPFLTLFLMCLFIFLKNFNRFLVDVFGLKRNVPLFFPMVPFLTISYLVSLFIIVVI